MASLLYILHHSTDEPDRAATGLFAAAAAARAGHDVALTWRHRREPAEEVADELCALGRRALAVRLAVEAYEMRTSLDRRFQVVMVEPSSGPETVDILKGLRDRYEKHHHVQITDDAIESAVELSGRPRRTTDARHRGRVGADRGCRSQRHAGRHP